MSDKIRRRKARERAVGTLTWARGPHAVGVKQIAFIAQRGQTWVKDHALDLGGRQFSNADLGINRPGHTWRFDLNVAKRRMEKMLP